MTPALARTDEFLRGTGPFAPERDGGWPGWWLPVMIIAFAPIYGAVMGSCHFDSAERLLQILYSAVKMPLLLFTTTAICLPGFFVLSTILGLRDDLRESFQAILAGQVGLTIALASLAPLTRFFYFSTESHRLSILFNAGMFTIATVAAQIVMHRSYRLLIKRHRNHRIMFYAWLVMYAFVGMQMGWVLRPFLGSPGLPTTFFRQDPFTNAYVVIARLIFGGG